MTTDVELFHRIRVYIQVTPSQREVYMTENVASVERAMEMVAGEFKFRPVRMLAVILGEKDA